LKNSLRELRKAREWSQSDLGANLQVSRQTIHAIESGKYDPSLPLAFKIAGLFNKPIEEIFVPDAPLPLE
jgi:putative transcriptional regulator